MGHVDFSKRIAMAEEDEEELRRQRAERKRRKRRRKRNRRVSPRRRTSEGWIPRWPHDGFRGFGGARKTKRLLSPRRRMKTQPTRTPDVRVSSPHRVATRGTPSVPPTAPTSASASASANRPANEPSTRRSVRLGPPLAPPPRETLRSSSASATSPSPSPARRTRARVRTPSPRTSVASLARSRWRVPVRPSRCVDAVIRDARDLRRIVHRPRVNLPRPGGARRARRARLDHLRLHGRDVRG